MQERSDNRPGAEAVTIRPLTPDDLPDLCAMVAALSAFHRDTSAATAETLGRDLFGTPPWFHGWIARDTSGKPLGYALALPTGQARNGIRGIDLHNLFVAQSARGRGIGRRLAAEVEVYARQVGAVYVVIRTDPGNHGAQASYERWGYGRRDSTGPCFSRRIAP